MLEKTVRVGDFDVKFRSSATIPRLYRIKFKRDIFKDLSKLEKTFKANEGSFEIDDLEIFENVAYIMQIEVSPEILMTGLTSLRCFLSMKSCLRYLNFGVQTLRQKFSLKKTSKK